MSENTRSMSPAHQNTAPFLFCNIERQKNSSNTHKHAHTLTHWSGCVCAFSLTLHEHSKAMNSMRFTRMPFGIYPVPIALCFRHIRIRMFPFGIRSINGIEYVCAQHVLICFGTLIDQMALHEKCVACEHVYSIVGYNRCVYRFKCTRDFQTHFSIHFERMIYGK